MCAFIVVAWASVAVTSATNTSGVYRIVVFSVASRHLPPRLPLSARALSLDVRASKRTDRATEGQIAAAVAMPTEAIDSVVLPR
jgi:hypothetical protein